GDQTGDDNGMQAMVDENGLPLGTPPPDQGYPQQQPIVRPDGTGEPTQQELDQAFPPQQQQPRQPGTIPPRQPPYGQPQPQQQPRQPQPQRQPPPGSTSPDPLEPRPNPA
ncbi:MAG TPA: hypothetical protein VGQ34_10290, partial [Sphingomicrobium sp.]|nr:hypothetical protein [Sphingomicrobium sp.]